jgi:hypothetical protein
MLWPFVTLTVLCAVLLTDVALTSYLWYNQIQLRFGISAFYAHKIHIYPVSDDKKQEII